MKLSDNKRKAASYGIVAVIAWFSGTVLPPEVIGQILGAF